MNELKTMNVKSITSVQNSLFLCAFAGPSFLSKSVAELALPTPVTDDDAVIVLPISGQLSASSRAGGDLEEEAANERAGPFEGMCTTNGSSTILLDALGAKSSG